MKAALLALSSVLLWASLATLGKRLGEVPPFFLLSIGFLIGASPVLFRPRGAFPSFKITATGMGGLFGYHFFLFLAIRSAPPVEANLISYLWPTLLVLATPLFLKGYPIGARQVLGVALAVFGNWYLVTGGAWAFDASYLAGYALALAAAVVWVLYSVTIKCLPPFPVQAVAGSCLGASILSYGAHLGFEAPYELTSAESSLVLLMGLGPMGLAFYAWNYAMKLGDPRIIGALSYLTPVFSTLALVIFGGEPFRIPIAVALACVIAGAVIGSGFSSKKQT